jgi:hypothetical protein
MKTKKNLENQLGNSSVNLKNKANDYISNNLSEFYNKLKIASKNYISKKIDDGFNNYSSNLNGGLANNSNQNNLKSELFSKLINSIDVNYQNTYNKIQKIANKKIDTYYKDYLSTTGGSSSSIFSESAKNKFRDQINKLKENVEQKLKEKIKGGSEHAKNYISSYLNKKLSSNNELRGGHDCPPCPCASQKTDTNKSETTTQPKQPSLAKIFPTKTIKIVSQVISNL